MVKNKYKLTVIFNFEAIDDIQARQFAGNLKGGMDVLDDGTPKPEFKLQKIYQDRQPDKIEI